MRNCYDDVNVRGKETNVTLEKNKDFVHFEKKIDEKKNIILLLMMMISILILPLPPLHKP